MALQRATEPVVALSASASGQPQARGVRGLAMVRVDVRRRVRRVGMVKVFIFVLGGFGVVG